jgi:hypothetical protein
MRSLLVLLVAAGLLGLALTGCGPDGSSSDASPGTDSTAADSTGNTDETGASAEQRAERLARRLIARTDSLFQQVDPLSATEKRRLRRYLQPTHIGRARRLGLSPVADRRAAADIETASSGEREAVHLYTNDFYIIDPAMSYAVAVVVPGVGHLLERIGRRFQTAMLERGLPPYRFVLTNVLRTQQDKNALARINSNVARGQSTHEFGTTIDIFYEWFHYAAVHDALAQAHVAPGDSMQAARLLDEAVLRKRLYAAYTRFGKEYAREIKAVLGRALLQMQDDGLLLATYERGQPVFHLTLAREVEAPAQPFAPAAALDSTQAAAPPSVAGWLSSWSALQ